MQTYENYCDAVYSEELVNNEYISNASINLEISSDGGLTFEVLEQWTLWLDVLNVSTILLNTTFTAHLQVFFTVKVGETPLLGNNDLLTTWELVTSTTKGFLDNVSVLVLTTDRDQDLTNVDTSDGTVWLTPSVSHTLLQSISTSARQHLVDTDDVEWVYTDTQVEGFLTGSLDNVLVASNTSSFERLRRELLELVRDKVSAVWEVVYGSLLTTQVEDTNLWVWDTTVVSRLWEWLVLDVSVATERSSTHCEALELWLPWLAISYNLLLSELDGSVARCVINL